MHMDVPTTQLLTQAQHRVERPPRASPVAVYFVQCVRQGGGETLDHAMKGLADARRDADKQKMVRYHAEASGGDGGDSDDDEAQGGGGGDSCRALLTLSGFVQASHADAFDDD